MTKYHISYQNNEVYQAILIEAKDEAHVKAYFEEHKPTAKVVGCRLATRDDEKPGKPVLTVPEDWTRQEESPNIRTQKELKATYTEELKKAWDSEKMVDYCAKKTAYIIEYNGGLFGIDKPSIQKDFCFGYGMYARATDEEITAAENMSERARTNEQYFIDENLRDINRWISQLENIAADMRLNRAEGSHPIYMLETYEHYYNQSKDCKLRNYSVVNTFTDRYNGIICKDVKFIELLIEGYKQVKADFIKRLNSYLKRYGLSKINTWTYLVD